MVQQEKFKEVVKRFYFDPYKFVKYVVRPKEITKQQTEILKSIPEALKIHKPIAAKSGHGVGKTALESWIILWWLTTRPNAKVPCTAPTQHQLYDVLWVELSKWLRQSRVKDLFDWTKTHLYSLVDKNSFAVALTSNTSEGMQGMHADNLLFIMEEASGIPNDIMEVVEGALTQEGAFCLMFGNPTQITGFFHNAFHKQREFYKCFTLSSEEAPSWLVKPNFYEKLAKKYGRDSDVYRVRVLGQFPKAEPDTLIPLSLVETAALREMDIPDKAFYETVEIGVDVARYGDDETAIYSRHENYIKEEGFFNKRDLMFIVGQIVKVIHKYSNKHVIVNVDDSGLGGGVTDRLKELVSLGEIECDVFGVNNGEKANDVKFLNKGAELWFFARDKITELKIPNDDELIAQLSSRKYGISSAGKHIVERKEQMKARGVKSPDRADAMILSLKSLIYDNTDRSGFAHVVGI